MADMKNMTRDQLKKLVMQGKWILCPSSSKMKKNDLTKVLRVLGIDYDDDDKVGVLRGYVRAWRASNCEPISKLKKYELAVLSDKLEQIKKELKKGPEHQELEGIAVKKIKVGKVKRIGKKVMKFEKQVKESKMKKPIKFALGKKERQFNEEEEEEMVMRKPKKMGKPKMKGKAKPKMKGKLKAKPKMKGKSKGNPVGVKKLPPIPASSNVRGEQMTFNEFRNEPGNRDKPLNDIKKKWNKNIDNGYLMIKSDFL